MCIHSPPSPSPSTTSNDGKGNEADEEVPEEPCEYGENVIPRESMHLTSLPSRQLKRAIDDRKAFQKKKAVIERAKKAKDARSKRGGAQRRDAVDEEEEEDEEEDAAEDDDGEDSGAEAGPSRFQGMSVEDFLGGGFKEGMDEDEDDEDDDAENDDAASLSDMDDISDGEMHAQDLEKLKAKDPDFYRYLQENDEELLNFAAGSGEDSDEEEDAPQLPKSAKGKGKATQEDEDEEEDDAHVVTMATLRRWQRAMIQHRSLKALRKLLLAFRSAAHMDDPEEEQRDSQHSFVVEEAAVFNKLLLTVLKYTPVVLSHHIPARETPQGKYKLPTNSK